MVESTNHEVQRNVNPFRLSYHQDKVLERYASKSECVENVLALISREQIGGPLANFLVAHICLCLGDAMRLMHGIPIPKTGTAYRHPEMVLDSLRWFCDEPVDDTPMFSTMTGGLEALSAMTGIRLDPEEVRAAIIRGGFDPRNLDAQQVVGQMGTNAGRCVEKPRERMSQKDKKRLKEWSRNDRREYRRG